MKRASAAGLLVVVLALSACGDDGGGGGGAGGNGDPDLVALLQAEAGQTESIATCIADKIAENDDVDRDALESIIRGEGTTDIDTADAYGDAAIDCAQEEIGDLGNLPGVP